MSKAAISMAISLLIKKNVAKQSGVDEWEWKSNRR
jgi:hypothetical protein